MPISQVQPRSGTSTLGRTAGAPPDFRLGIDFMIDTNRPLYGRADLSRLLAPRSVAIVGASAKPGAFSWRTTENMAHFVGDLFLVNPKHESVNGQVCYPSLSALPVIPDCVVVAVPQEAALEAVRAAGDLGVGGAIVYASGFAETGAPERIAQQRAMADIARGSGMRVLGPNCLGIANNLSGAGLLFQMGYSELERRIGRVGLVSQSGALGYAILQGTQHGFAYTHMLTAGNSCDVDSLDLANYLVEDPTCDVVACVLEAAGNAARLHALAERAREAAKPVIIYKTAVGEAAAAAAQSHTGSLAGSSHAFEAAMRRGNFVQVGSLAELTETANFFAKAPAPQAEGVAVMATSGGAAIMAADSAASNNVPLPQPGPAAQHVLDEWVPDFGSAHNPCDITGQVLNTPNAFNACVEAMLADPGYGALVLPQVTASQVLAEQRCPTMSRFAETSGKPVCIIWLSDWQEGPGTKMYASDDRIGFFRDTERCFKAIARWHAWHQRRAQAAALPQVPRASIGEIENADAASLRAQVLVQLRKQAPLVTERAAKKLMAQYGLPVIEEAIAATAQDAVGAANRLGYPVVLKFDAPDIAHKTEMGLVRINLPDAASVAAACADIGERMVGHDGVFLLQPMVRGHLELVLGMKRDPVFGPLVMVGMGGVLVELFGDVATEIAPVTAVQAHEMLQRLKGYRLLQGYRGKPGVDVPALAQLIVSFSQVCMDWADEVEEIDINPVICHAKGFTIVDALISRRVQPPLIERGVL